MTERYRVEGELVIRAQAGVNAVRALTDRLETLRSRLAGSQSLIGGVTRGLISMGAAYVGINALVGGMRSLVTSAVEYQQGLESTRIGLAAVMAAVEHIPFAQAQTEAGALFEQIQTDAIRSVATSRELFDIFQSIYGPLRAGGLAMDDIRGVMLDTVSAATALGIDLPQASRDIQMMARGAAGMHVRLFGMLRATGAIAEDAEAFNHLSQPERIAVLQRALGQFSEAADAYGHSFAGTTSTFRDIVENLTGAFFGPSFARLTTWLGHINDMLMTNRDSLRASLSEAGESLADSLGQAFAFIEDAMSFLHRNWDAIIEKGRALAERFHGMMPDIIRAAEMFLAFSAARSVLGMGLGAVSAVTGTVATMGELGMLGAGGAAAGAGAAGAAGATGAAGAGAVAATGGFAALGAALVGLLPVILGIVAVITALWSIGQVVMDSWDSFVAMFEFLRPLLDGMGEDFSAIGTDLWEILRPALTLIGTLLMMVLIPAFMALLLALRLLVSALRFVLDQARLYANMWEVLIVNPIRDAIMELGRYAAWLVGESEHIGREERIGRQAGGVGDGLEELRHRYEERGPMFGEFRLPEGMGGGTPSERRPTTVNDFRGSRITVNQEFRQADPDRIMMSMVDDINRQAEARIQSGYVPALTR